MTRRICKVYWSVVMRDEECEQVIGKVSEEVRRRRREMLGHVIRGSTPAKQCILELAETKRKVGRPPASLTNTIINDLKDLGKRHRLTKIEEIINLIADMPRQEYREWTRMNTNAA